MNNHLRGIQEDSTCEPILKDLTWAVRGLKTFKGPLYRGVHGNSFPASSMLKVGHCFADKGFVSTTPKKDLALAFTAFRDEWRLLFKIESKNGHDLTELGSSRGYSNQPEVIFLPDTHFLIQKIEDLKNMRLVHLKEVSPSTCSKVIY